MNTPVESSGNAVVRARYIITMTGATLVDGWVAVYQGRVIGLGAAADSAPTAERVINLGDAVLIPGLINAHTHLEFSQLQHPIGKAGTTLPTWIGEVIRWRMQQDVTPEAALARQVAAIRQGIQESYACGVMVLGDIATVDWPPDAKMSDSYPGILYLFRELLGLDDTRAEQHVPTAARHLAGSLPDDVHPAISPHAPYTVSLDNVRSLCELSQQHQRPVALHLAESQQELQLLHDQTGELADRLRHVNALPTDAFPRQLTPLDYLRLLAKSWRGLAIHGNYLADDEIRFVAEHNNLSVVYCPRTHAYFRHAPHPLEKLLDAGANVCVGTDSRASNPDLSVLSELRHIRQNFPHLADELILQLATSNAARALGLAAAGTIASGQRALFTYVALPRHDHDPFAALLASDAAPQPLAIQ